MKITGRLQALAKEKGWGPEGPKFNWAEIKNAFEEGEKVGHQVYRETVGMGRPSSETMSTRLD